MNMKGSSKFHSGGITIKNAEIIHTCATNADTWIDVNMATPALHAHSEEANIQ